MPYRRRRKTDRRHSHVLNEKKIIAKYIVLIFKSKHLFAAKQERVTEIDVEVRVK